MEEIACIRGMKSSGIKLKKNSKQNDLQEGEFS